MRPAQARRSGFDGQGGAGPRQETIASWSSESGSGVSAGYWPWSVRFPGRTGLRFLQQQDRQQRQAEEGTLKDNAVAIGQHRSLPSDRAADRHDRLMPGKRRITDAVGHESVDKPGQA